MEPPQIQSKNYSSCRRLWGGGGGGGGEGGGETELFSGKNGALLKVEHFRGEIKKRNVQKPSIAIIPV